MTNLDSVLKSRDITLPTVKVVVKAVVFPVVMDVRAGSERLSTKELMLLNCGVGESLGLQGNQTSHPQGNQP